MKAVRFHEYGARQVLVHETVPDPSPAPGEVVIRIRACAVNHVDLDIRAGTSRFPLSLPFVLGIEMAGEVVALGAGVRGVKLGDRVTPSFYLPCGTCTHCRAERENLCPHRAMFGVTRPGGYAELCSVPAASLMTIPESLGFDEAAAVQVAFGTAFHMLIGRARARAGETVLIQGAGSGIGSAAIQIAKRVGLRIITTASTREKLDRARELGADEVVDYTNEDFVERVMVLTDGAGVDIVFEHVGSDVFTRSVECLALRGRLVTCGAHAGELPSMDIIELFRKEASVIGSFTARLLELRQVMLLAALGKLQPVIGHTLALNEARRAHALLEERDNFGKIVLVP